MTTEEISFIKKFLKAADVIESYSRYPHMDRDRSSYDEYFKQRSAIIGIVMKYGALDKDED